MSSRACASCIAGPTAAVPGLAFRFAVAADATRAPQRHVAIALGAGPGRWIAAASDITAAALRSAAALAIHDVDPARSYSFMLDAPDRVSVSVDRNSPCPGSCHSFDRSDDMVDLSSSGRGAPQASDVSSSQHEGRTGEGNTIEGDKEGHVGGASREERKSPRCPSPCTPLLLHRVEREAGDFVPNNILYWWLRRSKTSGVWPDSAALNSAVANAATVSLTTDDSTTASSLSTHTSRQQPPAEWVEFEPTVEEAAASAANLNAGHVFTFFPYPCARTSVAWRTEHHAVLVNLMPVSPEGHVLVVPLRVVTSMVHLRTAMSSPSGGAATDCAANGGSALPATSEGSELRSGDGKTPQASHSRQQHGSGQQKSTDELTDWAAAVVEAMAVLRRRSETAADIGPIGGFSVGVQQGALSGQTVRHLHTHIIAIAAAGSALDQEPDPQDDNRVRERRSGEDMALEAAGLRAVRAAMQ